MKSLVCLITFFTIMELQGFNASKCCECTCLQGQSWLVNCSHRSLERIPHCSYFLKNISLFMLEVNNITRIEEDSFVRFVNLSSLQLSENKIYFIHKNAFRNLRNLKILNLRQNILAYSRSVYEPNMFDSLIRVTKLEINDNNINKTETSLSYPDYALSKLSALRELWIDGLESKAFGEGFLKLKHLQEIRIASDATQCAMSKITTDTFKSLPYLRGIFITKCNLSYVEPGSFKHQINLKSLHITDTPSLGFQGVTNATTDIHQTLETLYIYRIVAWDALCVVITKTFVQNLQNTSLRTLVANDNRIEAFEPGAIQLFPKTLKTVSMTGHNFQFSSYVYDIRFLTGLTVVDLTGKDIRNFNYFQAELHTMFKREEFSLLHSDMFDETSREHQVLQLPPNLKNLTFTYAQMYYSIGNLSVLANNLEKLNVSRNLLTRWMGPLRGLEGVREIDLSYNFAHEATTAFFENLPSLERLNISFNLLGGELKRLDSQNMFGNLNRLRSLDLSYNYIEYLPKFMFSNLSSLEYLDLSKNRIHSLDIELFKLQHLKTIICKNNSIQWLGFYARSQIDQIAGNGSIALDLSGNPIACTCNNLYFINWMLRSKTSGKVNFGDMRNYNCFYSTGRQESLEDLVNVYNKLTSMCHSNFGIFVVMFCVVLVSLSLILLGLTYRFRWKLRYFYYAARHRVNIKRSEETAHNYEYDAFVSFADEDRDFVVYELLDKLEGESRLKLNFHQRNFTAGRPIAENIIEAVKSSKKTLLILSKNFLASYWCIYELQMANMESVTTGRDVLLIVMMENIPTRQIPTQILYHIQTDSYIQYPAEGDTDMFWRNLTDSLKR